MCVASRCLHAGALAASPSSALCLLSVGLCLCSCLHIPLLPFCLVKCILCTNSCALCVCCTVECVNFDHRYCYGQEEKKLSQQPASGGGEPREEEGKGRAEMPPNSEAGGSTAAELLHQNQSGPGGEAGVIHTVKVWDSTKDNMQPAFTQTPLSWVELPDVKWCLASLLIFNI